MADLTLEEARRILVDCDASDPARAIAAVATVLRFEGIADAKLLPIAGRLESVADGLRGASLGVTFANCKWCGLEREDAGPAKGCPTGYRCAHLSAEESKAMHDRPELFEARKRVSRLLADRGIYLYYTAIDEVVVAARQTNVDEAWLTRALRLVDAYKTAPGSKTEAAADAMIAHLRTVNAGEPTPAPDLHNPRCLGCNKPVMEPGEICYFCAKGYTKKAVHGVTGKENGKC